MPQNGTSGGSVQSLERAFDLLELLADSGGALGLSQPSSSSGLPPTTIHRLGAIHVGGAVQVSGVATYASARRSIRGPDLRVHASDPIRRSD